MDIKRIYFLNLFDILYKYVDMMTGICWWYHSYIQPLYSYTILSLSVVVGNLTREWRLCASLHWIICATCCTPRTADGKRKLTLTVHQLLWEKLSNACCWYGLPRFSFQSRLPGDCQQRKLGSFCIDLQSWLWILMLEPCEGPNCVHDLCPFIKEQDSWAFNTPTGSHNVFNADKAMEEK